MCSSLKLYKSILYSFFPQVIFYFMVILLLFMCRPVNGYLNYFCYWAIMCEADVKIQNMRTCRHSFSFPSGRFLKVELLSCMISLFNLLRNYQTIFQSDCSTVFTTSSTLGFVCFHGIAIRVSIVPHCMFNVPSPAYK